MASMRVLDRATGSEDARRAWNDDREEAGRLTHALWRSRLNLMGMADHPYKADTRVVGEWCDTCRARSGNGNDYTRVAHHSHAVEWDRLPVNARLAYTRQAEQGYLLGYDRARADAGRS